MSAEIAGTFVTSYLIPVIIALTGFLMAIGKLRVLKPKESTQTNNQKSHEQVLKENPIFNYVDRDVQRAQSAIDELREKVEQQAIKIERLEGAINVLRAELARK